MSDKIKKEAKSLEDLPKEMLAIRDLAKLERTSKDISVWAKEQKDKKAQQFHADLDTFIERARRLAAARAQVDDEDHEVWE